MSSDWCCTLDPLPPRSLWFRFKCEMNYRWRLACWHLARWWYPQPVERLFGDIRTPPSMLFRPSAEMVESYRRGVMASEPSMNWYLDAEVDKS